MSQDNQSIFDIVLNRIINLEYEPGRLLSEKQLIEEFEVSRTPIREVLLKLSEKGFVKLVPRVGTYVTQIDLRNVKHAYEVKKRLESLACELAAERISPEEAQKLVEMSYAIRTLDPQADYQAYIDFDYKFRKEIRRISKNPYLIEYLEDLNVKTMRFVKHIEYKMDDATWYDTSMKEIALAIQDRDANKARLEMDKHSDIFLEELSKRFFL
jgi:DNA-binding GntR family transcriptional regulator